jgi:hypothetical protein
VGGDADEGEDVGGALRGGDEGDSLLELLGEGVDPAEVDGVEVGRANVGGGRPELLVGVLVARVGGAPARSGAGALGVIARAGRAGGLL